MKERVNARVQTAHGNLALEIESQETSGHDHEACGCGHEHTHDDDHHGHAHTEAAHAHGEEACGCGHEHTHDDDHHGHAHTEAAHAHGEEACGCGHEHTHDDDHHGHAHTEAAHAHGEEACGCGHDHTHDHHGHAHTEATHAHGEEACGCGHDHGHGEHVHDDGCDCGHTHGDTSHIKQDVIAVSISAAALVAGLIVTQPVARTLLLVVSILVAGLPIFWKGIKNIFKLDLEELALLTVAVIAAVCLGEWFEAALVTLLFRFGEILEDLAISRSQREVEAVTKIIPDDATLVLEDGTTRTVSAKTLAPGSLILVKSGERLPVDCQVVSGSSTVDTSSLTGESLPREIGPGDSLLSSSINLGGVLTCRTTSRFEDSAAAKIIEMVRESAAKKGNTEKLISRFARVYTPIVMISAVAVALLPPLFQFGSFSMWIYRALVFLVAACPCALVIATPLAFFAGIGAASKQGILIKGSRYVEALAKTGSVVFDKTGTLTTGRPKVTDIIPAAGQDKDQVLRLAALCESASTHPIAQAVVAAYGQSPDLSQVTAIEEITAQGMRAMVEGKETLCGSARMMNQNGVDISALPDAPLYVAQEGAALGAILVADQPRPDAAEAIAGLGKLGITKTAMLTGDAHGPAREVQQLTGIGEVHASLLPGDKVTRFEQIKGETTGSCVFVGDGINDSPVLARSDVGVAMGLASDAAMQAADVVLLSDKLSSLPRAIRLARATARLARIIIAFALVVKLGVLVLAFFGVANMLLAVFADVGVTILSVLAATAALRFR